MKNFIALFITLTIIFSFAGCVSEQANGGNESNAVSGGETKEIGKADADISVAERVVFESNGIKMTVKGLDTDGLFGVDLNLFIENNGTQDITVQARNLSVNGIMADHTFSCDVAAGKKANDEISISSEDLEEAGVKVIKDIEFNFHVFDMESWNTVVDSDVIRIETNAAPSYVQNYDDSGFVAVNKDGIKLVIKKLDSDDSFWGADVYVYAENNSDKNVTVQVRDVSINGFMVDPTFSCDIIAGKKAFDTIYFMQTDLEDNGITDITEMELYFHIFDMDSWNEIFDSDIVKVTF